MTITAQQALIEQYIGNGTQKDWPVTFPFLAEQDLGVILTAPDAAQSKLLLHKDYTIQRTEEHTGGTVTVVVPENYRLTIYLEQPCTQEMDLRNNGILDAEMLEYSLDKLTLLVGQLRDRVALCVQTDITDMRSPQEVFRASRDEVFAARDEATARAGMVIAAVENALAVAARVEDFSAAAALRGEKAASAAEASAEAARQIASQGNEDATETIKGITRLGTRSEHLQGAAGVAAQPAHVAAMVEAVLGAAIPTPSQEDINKALVVQSDLTLGFGSGFPAGGIILWSGGLTSVPTGWALCNGANGTPDLRDRFVVGAGSTCEVGATGGGATHMHTAAIGATTLTTAQIPSHTHAAVSATVATAGLGAAQGAGRWNGDGYTYVYPPSATAATGGGGSHTHTGTVEASSSLPPYFALAYIMKL